MAEADKLNIDSIIQRLLEGKSKDLSIFISQGSHFSSHARQPEPRMRCRICLRKTVTFANSILFSAKQTFAALFVLISSSLLYVFMLRRHI